MDIAERNGSVLRRSLARAERRNDWATARGESSLNTPGSRSRALLVVVTRCDQRLLALGLLSGPCPCPCSAETLAAPCPDSKGRGAPTRGPASPRGRERHLAGGRAAPLRLPGAMKAPVALSLLRTIDGRGPLPLLAETLATPRPHSKGCGAPARGPASPSRREPRGPSRLLCPQCNRRDSRHYQLCCGTAALLRTPFRCSHPKARAPCGPRGSGCGRNSLGGNARPLCSVNAPLAPSPVQVASLC